jgi:hypothetical protein
MPDKPAKPDGNAGLSAISSFLICFPLPLYSRQPET